MSTGPSPAESLAPLVCALVAIGLATISLFGAGAGLDFPIDDAWIHLAYAKSLRLGEGLSYNPGDWETGFSSPLWVAILAAWPLPRDPTIAVKLLGALLHGATAWVGASLAGELGRRYASLDRPVPVLGITGLAGILCATQPTLLQAATSGMEVPLTAAAVLGCFLAIARNRAVAAGALGFAGVLARPEVLLCLAPAGVFCAWRGRRQVPLAQGAGTAAALGAAVALALWMLYCLTVSGYPFPNTQYIKGAGGGLDGLAYLAQEVLPFQPWLISLTGVVLVGLALRQELASRQDPPPILTAMVGAYAITLVAIAVSRPLHPGVLFYESRYFAPFSGLPCVVLPFGLLSGRRWLTAALLLPVAVATGLLDHHLDRLRRAQERSTRRLHTAAARYVARELPADATVAVEGAGAQRFFTPRTMTIVDLVGLNDREAAHLHFDRDAKLCHLVRRAPTHMVIPAEWIPIYTGVFDLRPRAAFEDPAYAQIAPPRPLRVVVLDVTGIHPAWNARCSP